ncbi:MAG: N-acetylmuramoyl-L-alanine amidase [bacterium]|jgi:N-acetylmuramoyl-L-alanine amidase
MQQIIRYVCLLLYSILTFILLISPQAAAAPVTVTGSTVNIRNGPSLQAEVIAQAAAGDELESGGAEGEWLLVSLPEGGTGYLHSSLAAQPTQAVCSVRTAADILIKPGNAGAAIRWAADGERFLITALSEEWAAVAAGEQTGWLPRSSLYINTDFAAVYCEQNIPLAVTATANVNLRKGPSTGYSVIRTIPNHSEGTVLGAKEGWVEAGFGSDAGWACADYLCLSDPSCPEVSYGLSATAAHISYRRAATVTAGILNLRSAPSLTAPLRGKAARGDKYELLRQENEWALLSDGQTEFWAHTDYLQFSGGGPIAGISLEEKEDGRYLTVMGALQQVLLFMSPDRTSIRVDLGCAGLVPAELPVHLAEVVRLGVNARGVYVDLTAPADITLIEKTNDKLKLRFSSTVQAVTAREEKDRTVYEFAVAGSFGLEREAADGFMATLSRVGKVNEGELPEGVVLQNEGDVLRLQIRNPRSNHYLVRLQADGFAVEALYPGMAGKRIVIDPGHGGADPGAVGRSYGTKEKDINLAMALALAEELRNRGAEVILTRESDNGSEDAAVVAAESYSRRRQVLELDARARLAREEKADIFISVHNNSNVSRVHRGTSTYYALENINFPASGELAAAVHPVLLSALSSYDFGIRTADFHVIKYCEVPGILLEVLFLSNESDEQRLMQPETAAVTARAVAEGVENYFTAVAGGLDMAPSAGADGGSEDARETETSGATLPDAES